MKILKQSTMYLLWDKWNWKKVSVQKLDGSSQILILDQP